MGRISPISSGRGGQVLVTETGAFKLVEFGSCQGNCQRRRVWEAETNCLRNRCNAAGVAIQEGEKAIDAGGDEGRKETMLDS